MLKKLNDDWPESVSRWTEAIEGKCACVHTSKTSEEGWFITSRHPGCVIHSAQWLARMEEYAIPPF